MYFKRGERVLHGDIILCVDIKLKNQLLICNTFWFKVYVSYPYIKQIRKITKVIFPSTVDFHQVLLSFVKYMGTV